MPAKIIVGTSYTLLPGDNGGNIIFTNSGAITVTLPPPSSVPADFSASLQAISGTITIDADPGVTGIPQINLANTLALAAGGGANVVLGEDDNWYTFKGDAASGGGISGLTTNTIPKATSSTSIGDSSVSDNGTVVTVANQLTVDNNLITTGDAEIGGEISVVAGHEFRFNGPSDANWRMGYGLSAYTCSVVGTATSIQIVTGTGGAGPDGFAIGPTGGAGNSFFEIDGSTGKGFFRNGFAFLDEITIGTPTAGPRGTGTINAQGLFVDGASLNAGSFTVATLPVGPPQFTRAFVTDATAPVFAATLTGGGGVICPVYYDGTQWLAG
jgi:hypothetical protein